MSIGPDVVIDRRARYRLGKPVQGPGSGFWPFWLSLGMLLCSIATLVRWFLRSTPESRSKEIYMSRNAVIVVGSSVGALLVLLIGIHVIGTYFSLIIFLALYLKLLGRHDWPLTVMLSGGIPVFIFALFEWGLQIPLPKAYTEEWFYPIYDIMYGTDVFGIYVIGAIAAVGVVSYAIKRLSAPGNG